MARRHAACTVVPKEDQKLLAVTTRPLEAMPSLAVRAALAPALLAASALAARNEGFRRAVAPASAGAAAFTVAEVVAFTVVADAAELTQL